MRRRRTSDRRGRSPERGSVAVIVLFGLAALLSVTALAVEVGSLYAARAEVQRVADLTAHAGAGVLAHVREDPAAVRSAVGEVLRSNPVAGGQAELRAEDLEIRPDSVRVTIRRALGRGGALSALLSRAGGPSEIGVVATATAEVWPAGGVVCPLPLAIPDRWVDRDGNRRWDPGVDAYAAEHTGFAAPDVGLRLELAVVSPARATRAGSAPEPGTREPRRARWFDPAGGHGDRGGSLRSWIEGCPDPSRVVRRGAVLWTAPIAGGRAQAVQAFASLVDADPATRWDPARGCAARRGSCVTDSPRQRPVVLFGPASAATRGSGAAVAVTNLAGLFVEKVAAAPHLPHRGGPADRWRLYVRLTRSGGVGGLGTDASHSLVSRPRIVR